ncbi:ferritin-like domain-containing protein [Clostridium rectalis]|uniref:ferritin-like domain-containing protein n=1 Tax=Clostridium rectalis TaxID=2040295 RepID=UPI001FAAA24D|nr:ferritin-like domain-containing protein [Clostridium rectalis]
MECSKEKNFLNHMKNTGINMRKYQLPGEYEAVCVNKEDKKWLHLIFQDYSSKVSEYTAVSQYIYAHFISENYMGNSIIKEIAQAFLGIAIVEMFHLDILGDLILKLGGNPKFRDGSKKNWKSNFVPYGRSVKENLQLAIKAENEAINQYEKHIKIIKNQSINKLLMRIVDDELLHLQIFKQLLIKLEKTI